jgi:hypothetical protein
LIGAGKTHKTRVTKKHSGRTRKAKVLKKHCFGSRTTTTASSSSSQVEVEGIGTPSLEQQQQPVNISNSPAIIQNNNNKQELLGPRVTEEDLAYLASRTPYYRNLELDFPPHTNCLCSQRRELGNFRFYTEEEEEDIIFNGWSP